MHEYVCGMVRNFEDNIFISCADNFGDCVRVYLLKLIDGKIDGDRKEWEKIISCVI